MSLGCGKPRILAQDVGPRTGGFPGVWRKSSATLKAETVASARVLRATIRYDELPMTFKLTAVCMKAPEGYLAFVEELPGAESFRESGRHAVYVNRRTRKSCRDLDVPEPG